MSIEVLNISKRFGTYEALNNVSLRIETGELVALLGPSGSGKTTLLRIIAGLEQPDSGAIRLHDEDATKSTARDRQVGFVFQHYALFRHLTVFENIAFGLRLRPKRTRPTEKDIRDRVKKLLELIGLDWLGDRYPNQLSGGQRQRVALARALAVEPRVLLLDEPFGALDAKVRKELRRWLRQLHDELHVASVFVTHDQEEALEVSDRVAIMNQGKIEQAGTPVEVYDHPANAFVYRFLGDVNLFHGRTDGPSAAYVRPYELQINRLSETNPDAVIATVRFVAAVGSTVRVDLRREDTGAFLEAEITRDRPGTRSKSRRPSRRHPAQPPHLRKGIAPRDKLQTVPLTRAPILLLCFALLVQAPVMWAKDRWNELNVGPFFVDSETDSDAAHEVLTQLEQLRWVLGGLLESKDLESVWPIRVILNESAKKNPTTAGTEFVLQNGRYTLLTAPGARLPLGQVAAILLEANTPRMPPEVESGLQQLFDTLEAHGSKVTWGGPPVLANLAYARMQLLATKFEYGASLHIFMNSLRGGSTLRAAERNAFNRDPATIEKEAADRLAKADWQPVSVSGKPLNPKRDFGQHSLDPIIAGVYLADSQLNVDPKAAEAAYKAAVEAGGATAALGYEGLIQIAKLNRVDSALFVQSAIKAGSKSAPVYVTATEQLGDMATDDQALPLLKRAAELNPRWAEAVFRQAEFTYDMLEREQIIKNATQLDPRISHYWIELAKIQTKNGHVQAAQGSWLRAEDSAPNEAEHDRIHALREGSEDERLDAAETARRREREAVHLADQRAQQSEMDRIHAAEAKANKSLDAASGTEVPADVVPWNAVVPKKKVTGVLTQVDCLHTGVRLLVKTTTGQLLPLFLKDATPLNLSCGAQPKPRRASISYSAEPDENRHTEGNITSIQWQ